MLKPNTALGAQTLSAMIKQKKPFNRGSDASQVPGTLDPKLIQTNHSRMYKNTVAKIKPQKVK